MHSHCRRARCCAAAVLIRGSHSRVRPEGGVLAALRLGVSEEAAAEGIWETRGGRRPGRRTFVQPCDTDALDSSLRLMPLCKSIAPTDPRSLPLSLGKPTRDGPACNP